ncbi:hypothetical protein DPR00_17870 [Burkholderia pseudomallei]|nr:hypothetical protein CNX72_29745 [Burkholderia pseudomallei]EDO93491.1 hypothetical protein BURPSPAST_J0773 [Burkholderia pseudomallei Pasteur 52237]EEP49306.1 conserved hypothetical protein [Burkholderia pseudomallei MSHR346]AYX04339.1 hypothetical protein EGY14_11350 [Burkholderia pseudomallei]PNX01600.1 hypothetical protein CF641_26330 [Burkholderia pseudomallei]
MIFPVRSNATVCEISIETRRAAAAPNHAARRPFVRVFQHAGAEFRPRGTFPGGFRFIRCRPGGGIFRLARNQPLSI